MHDLVSIVNMFETFGKGFFFKKAVEEGKLTTRFNEIIIDCNGYPNETFKDMWDNIENYTYIHRVQHKDGSYIDRVISANIFEEYLVLLSTNTGFYKYFKQYIRQGLPLEPPMFLLDTMNDHRDVVKLTYPDNPDQLIKLVDQLMSIAKSESLFDMFSTLNKNFSREEINDIEEMFKNKIKGRIVTSPDDLIEALKSSGGNGSVIEVKGNTKEELADSLMSGLSQVFTKIMETYPE